jgi:hypothetical protein
VPGLADLAPEGVDDVRPRPRDPGEKVLVRRLHALLPDRLAGPRRVRVAGARLRPRRDLLGGGLAEVTEKMGGRRALRVDAALGLLDDELGMLERPRLNGAHFGNRQVLLQHDRHEVVVRAVALDAALQVLERPVEELGDETQRGVEVFRLPPVEEKRERRLVLGEDDPVAVENESARRRDGHAAQAIVLGLAFVLLAAQHLMDPVDAGEDADEDPRAARDDVEARQDGAAVFTRAGGHQVNLTRRRASRRCFHGTRDAA